MKLHTSNFVIALLALLLACAMSVMAQQTSKPAAEKSKSESCCAMDSCCKGDSCAMHKEGATQTAATDGCCCSGDSCDMMSGAADASKNSADMTKHTMHDKKDHSSCCNMKPGSAGDMKPEGSCCDMKHDGSAGDMKHDGSCCNMKQKDKQKEAKKQQKAA